MADRSSSYSTSSYQSVTSPLLRLNSEGNLVGKHLHKFGSTDRMRFSVEFSGSEMGQEAELGVDFCLTWTTDPR